MSKGIKTSEFIALIAGLIVAILPAFIESVPKGSMWAVILPAVYMFGRNYLKAQDIKGKALVEASKAQAQPPDPQ